MQIAATVEILSRFDPFETLSSPLFEFPRNERFAARNLDDSDLDGPMSFDQSSILCNYDSIEGIREFSN